MKAKVVAIAFTCRPNAGSEYEVGWRWSQAAGIAGNTLTLTRASCFNALPAEVEFHHLFGRVKKIGNSTYRAVDLPAAELYFVGRRFMRVHYIIWQILVLFWVRQYRTNFDFAHHICFVSTWLPPLVALSGLRYVWGPVGTSGALPTWARKGIRANVWNFITQTITRNNPFLNWVVKGSSLIIPINSHVAKLVSACLSRRMVIRPSVAQDLLPGDHPRAKYKNLKQATVICSTRNVPIKMPDLCFQTCIKLAREHPYLTVKIFGEQVDELFKSELTNLHIIGALAQSDFFQELERAQLLLFPTLEGSGFVALEALARGLPTVCLNGSGPSDFIAENAGISVPIANDQAKTVSSLVDACVHLLCNQNLWEQSADAAINRASLYTWSAINILLKEEYEKIF